MQKVIQSLKAEIEKRQAALEALLALGYSDEEEEALPIQNRSNVQKMPQMSVRHSNVIESIKSVFVKQGKKELKSSVIIHTLRMYFSAHQIRDCLTNNEGKHFKRVEYGIYKVIEGKEVSEDDDPTPNQPIGTTAAVIKVMNRSKKPLSVAQIVERLNGKYTSTQVAGIFTSAIQSNKYFTRVGRGIYELKRDEPEAEEPNKSPVKRGNITEAIKEVLKRYAREMTVEEIAGELSAQYTHRQVQSLLYCTQTKSHFDRIGKGTYVLKGMVGSSKSDKKKDEPINLVERIREHLRQSDEPLSVDELVERLGDTTKPVVSTIMYGYSYRGQYFKSGLTRDGVATFELISKE